MSQRWINALAALLLVACTSIHAAGPEAIEGNWYTADKEGVVELVIQPDGSLKGTIVGGNSPGKKDSNNPDPAKRELELRGQTILQGLRFDGDGKWSGGTIYDPNSGKTYKLKASLATPDLLELRGFIGISLLGRTSEWTRKTD